MVTQATVNDKTILSGKKAKDELLNQVKVEICKKNLRVKL